MDDDASREEAPEKAPPAGEASSDGEGKGSRRWWYVLLVVLVVEFYAYGRNGEIQVCVGKEGQHDFALIGQERDDTNRWKFPRCEVRENLGLRSQFDEMVVDATKSTCRGQTLLRNRGEGPACLEQKDGWQRQVSTRFIPPWDSRYYQHLLWFLY
jgi:hypothetical protein